MSVADEETESHCHATPPHRSPRKKSRRRRESVVPHLHGCGWLVDLKSRVVGVCDERRRWGDWESLPRYTTTQITSQKVQKEGESVVSHLHGCSWLVDLRSRVVGVYDECRW